MKKKYIQTFIVDTAKWKHSHSFTNYITQLYDKDGKQEMICCLGFVCNQLGIPKKDLKHRAHPYTLSSEWTIPYLLEDNGFSTELTKRAISINDSEKVSVADKKRKLKKLFNSYDLDIKFKRLS
jgi:hypothetical protein